LRTGNQDDSYQGENPSVQLCPQERFLQENASKVPGEDGSEESENGGIRQVEILKGIIDPKQSEEANDSSNDEKYPNALGAEEIIWRFRIMKIRQSTEPSNEHPDKDYFERMNRGIPHTQQFGAKVHRGKEQLC
jgi:hypothetical protein